MTREQLDLIPDHLLFGNRRHGCTPLIDWLHARGWSMSLQELAAERARRKAIR